LQRKSERIFVLNVGKKAHGRLSVGLFDCRFVYLFRSRRLPLQLQINLARRNLPIRRCKVNPQAIALIAPFPVVLNQDAEIVARDNQRAGRRGKIDLLLRKRESFFVWRSIGIGFSPPGNKNYPYRKLRVPLTRRLCAPATLCRDFVQE
jgi:hypothetical protein